MSTNPPKNLKLYTVCTSTFVCYHVTHYTIHQLLQYMSYLCISIFFQPRTVLLMLAITPAKMTQVADMPRQELSPAWGIGCANPTQLPWRLCQSYICRVKAWIYRVLRLVQKHTFQIRRISRCRLVSHSVMFCK